MIKQVIGIKNQNTSMNKLLIQYKNGFAPDIICKCLMLLFHSWIKFIDIVTKIYTHASPNAIKVINKTN